MSLFPAGLSFVLDNEDRQRQFAIVNDVSVHITNPDGSITVVKTFAISGINSRSFPTAYDNIARTPQNQRGPAVANFYLTEFWNVMRLAGLNSQDLANRVLDEGVNAGLYTATKMLQQAANTLGAAITVDGILGPVSIGALNALDEDKLLSAFRQLRMKRYQDIAAAHPADAPYLKAWEARAAA